MAHNSTYTVIGTRAKLTELGISPILGGKGLGIHEIAKCLHRSRCRSLGQLCGDVNASGAAQGKITPWAIHKPVRYHKKGELTDAELRDVNYGFDLSAVSASDVSQVFILAAANNDAWPLLHPRGKVGEALNPTANDEWFRTLDFNGYNHAAPAPYEISGPGHLSVRENKIVAVHEHPDAEIRMSNLSEEIFNQADPSEVYVYLLFRISGSNQISIITPVGGLVSVEDIISDSSHNVRFNVPFTWQGVPLSRTFEMVAAASAWDSTSGDSSDEFDWIFLPGTRQLVTIDDQNHILDIAYEYDLTESFIATVDAYATQLTLALLFMETNKSMGTSAQNIQAHLEVEYFDGTYYEPIFSGDYSSGPLSTDDEQLLLIRQVINLDDTDGDLSNIYIRLWYQFSPANEPSYTYYRYFDFLARTGQTFSYTPDATHSGVPRVSIQDILDEQ